MYIDDLDLIVEYKCGCKGCIRVGVNLPRKYCEADRTPENDKKLIDYLMDNYQFDAFACQKKHRNLPSGFDRIVEVM